MASFSNIARSYAAKLAVLLIILVCLPIVVYQQLQLADQQRSAVLRQGIQEEGWLISQALMPHLENFDGDSVGVLVSMLERLGAGRSRIRLLFRPRIFASAEDFLLVASVPTEDSGDLVREQLQPLGQGIISELPRTCEGEAGVARHHRNPDGGLEVLTSITPVRIRAGCWIVITSKTAENVLPAEMGRPYWQEPEIQTAAVLYLVMVSIVLGLFVGVWRNIRGFSRLARDMRTGRPGGRTFVSMNAVPELMPAAREFDALVGNLRRSAERMREAAEENAHALKGPVSVIAQSLDLLREDTGGSARTRTTYLDYIDNAVTRLDALINAARRLDQVTADLMEPTVAELDLSALTRGVVEEYALGAGGGVTLVNDVEPDIRILGSEELMETVLENLIDNAMSFAPQGSDVFVVLKANGTLAHLAVEDEGPGVAEPDLTRIFDRYYSLRPARRNNPCGAETTINRGEQDHFGIGLWIAKRNVEAVGGTIQARNRQQGGLRVHISVPMVG